MRAFSVLAILAAAFVVPSVPAAAIALPPYDCHVGIPAWGTAACLTDRLADRAWALPCWIVGGPACLPCPPYVALWVCGA